MIRPRSGPTRAAQVEKPKRRFHLTHVAVVGDRRMVTEARIDTLLKPAGLDWITALRAPTMQKLLNQGAFSCRCSMNATSLKLLPGSV